MTNEKGLDLTELIKEIFQVDPKRSARNGFCIPPPFGCGQPVGEFKNDLYRREYNISGLCPKCQDKVFEGR